MIEARDVLGKLLKVGDMIVYPVRHGSYMGMKKGVIVDIQTVQRYYDRYERPILKLDTGGSRVVTVEAVDRVAKVEPLPVEFDNSVV